MSQFELKGMAVIRHLNIRKEGNDDEKQLAVDIKFEAETDADILLHLNSTLKGFLFEPLEDGYKVRIPPLRELQWDSEILHCTLTMIDHQRTYHTSVKKIRFTPKVVDGEARVIFGFSVSIDPESNELARLSEFLGEPIDVAVEAQPDLFAGHGSDDEYDMRRAA